jgi:hypothetical protein
MTRIALAFVHGMGTQGPNFAKHPFEALRTRFASRIRGEAGSGAGEELVTLPVHWAPVFSAIEDDLLTRLSAGGPLDYRQLRRFFVTAFGDAAAYQINTGERDLYDRVHAVFAATLRQLAASAGADAPLAVMAHSLGAMIASNYLWDLESSTTGRKPLVPTDVQAAMTGGSLEAATPLERAETFALFFSVGTTIPIWSLRYADPPFGTPIAVPSPHLVEHHPAIEGGWWNYYDDDDVLGYPLKTLNEEYGRVVSADKAVSVGSLFTGWTPLSHTRYFSDRDIINPIADRLATAWKQANGFS